MTHSDYSPATRPEPGQVYSGFGAHSPYSSQYVATQAQVPSGLPSALSLISPTQQYTGTHDAVQTHYGHPYAQNPAYLETPPRQNPEITSFTPHYGHQGTKVTVYFRSIYDLDSPQIPTFLMFGLNKRQSFLQKTAQHGEMYQYALTADAPSLVSTNASSPVPLHLVFDDSSTAWGSPSLEFGAFTYLDTPAYYPCDSPQETTRKRKLSIETSPRRTPSKKPSTQQLNAFPRTHAQVNQSSIVPVVPPFSPFRRPSLPDAYNQDRRFSPAEYQPSAYSAPLPVTQPYYAGPPSQLSTTLHTAQSPSWNYQQGVPFVDESSSSVTTTASNRTSHLLPSPTTSNPPLIRTSTLQ